MIEISIIIPIYNAEEHLERCVYSAMKQTEKNIEIILIDDGSGDRSLEICQKLKNQDNRIKVLHQINAGVSAI